LKADGTLGQPVGLGHLLDQDLFSRIGWLVLFI
jgi:hypothetical protein